jgi:TIR domain
VDQVFISYSAEDEATARLVEQALRRRGLETWSARHLTVGSDWSKDIAAALNSAAAVIVLVTPESLKSNWVSHEWASAIAGSKRVIPALAGGAAFSDLPPLLATRQGVDLNTDLDAGVDRIAGALEPLRHSGEPPPSAHVDIEAIVEDIVERKLATLGVVRSHAVEEVDVEDPESVFVIASFAADMEPAFEAIKVAAESVGLRAFRVKDVAGDYRITDRILASIRRARFVVVDLTHERPNVYFELGYARGLGKTVITIMREGTTAHFDVQDWTYLTYSDSRPLERDLVERFRYEMNPS